MSDQFSGQTHQKKNPSELWNEAVSGRRQTGRLVVEFDPFGKNAFAYTPHTKIDWGFNYYLRQTAKSDANIVSDVSGSVKPYLQNNFHED